jgi:hypothetical protein
MTRRLFSWVLFFALALVTAVSCSSGASDAPPPLNQTALAIHVCLRTEPDNTGPCTDEALTTCPSGMSRDACLATALDELAAFDAHAASPPEQNSGLPLPTILTIVGATLGVFAIVVWLVARKSAARNQRAFDDELPVLLTRGFVDAQHSLPAGVTIRGTTRRALFRNGEAMVWLLESESMALAINSLPPTRFAVIQFDHPVPTGQLTQSRRGVSGSDGGVVSTFGASDGELAFLQTLRRIVDPLFPKVTVEAGGTTVVLRSVQVAKSIGSSPVPISLVALGDAAITLADTPWVGHP